MAPAAQAHPCTGHRRHSYLDLVRARGEFPRRGYGRQSTEAMRAEITRKLSYGQHERWIISEAVRLGLIPPEHARQLALKMGYRC